MEQAKLDRNSDNNISHQPNLKKYIMIKVITIAS